MKPFLQDLFLFGFCKGRFDRHSEETMITQLEFARQGTLTPEINIVAEKEDHTERFIPVHVAKGEIVIPCNPNRKNQIVTCFRTKVNASIGTSSHICDTEFGFKKTGAPEQKETCTLCSAFCAMKKGLEKKYNK